MSSNNTTIPSVESNPELWTNLREVDVKFEDFYLIGAPKQIKPEFTVRLTEVTCNPLFPAPSILLLQCINLY